MATTAWGQVLTLGAPVKNAGNSADEFSDGLTLSFQRQTTITVVNNTTSFFTVRYAEIVAADAGAFSGDRTQTQATDYTIPFTVNAPGAYRLNISTSLNGAFTRVDDGGGNASLDMSAITGTHTGGTLAVAGSLNRADPGNVANGGGNVNTPFASAGPAQINHLSNGVTQNHTLRFTWSATCTTDATGFLNINGGDECAVRLGLPATISGQTAGQYPGVGGRTQSLDGHFVTVKLESFCGNGTIDGSVGEQCDQGANNGLATSCCTSTCQHRAAGQTCRPVAGICDTPETCTGSSGACPANQFLPNTTQCRAAAGVCDNAENCTGGGALCPPDGVKNIFDVCRSAAGVCDLQENCDGTNVNCPADAKRPSGLVCRLQTGFCDIAEECDGVNDDCPADVVQPNTTLCRAQNGICDIAEFCDGVNKPCPPDAVEPSTTECRGVAGVCDQAENCDGTNKVCPPDIFLGSVGPAFVCRSAAGVCDAVENCPGTGPHCPSDAKLPSSTVCRGSAGICDVVENCTGIGDNCPTDAFQPSSTVCRSAAHDCDAVENCTGGGALCPSDIDLPDDDNDGFCNVVDTCPSVPDPGQEDDDGDDAGNACDPCTNILPSFADRSRVLVSKLLTPPGDDRLKIQGRCVPFVENPLVDPVANGVRMVMQDSSFNMLLDVTIPPGAYNTADKAGWKVHSFPTCMTALYKNAGTIIPYVQGIKTMKFVIKSGVGIGKFKMIGKNGSYPVPTNGLPVKVTFVAAPPVSQEGQCCEMFFPGEPLPKCVFTSGGNTLKCR